MMSKKFVLLKQSFPKSRKERNCDAYDIIINNTTPEQRQKLDIKDSDLTKKIYPKDIYLYRVGKEDNKFKALHISLNNYEIIRKKLSNIL